MENLPLNMEKILYTLIMLLIIMIIRFILSKIIGRTTEKWERLQTRAKLIKKIFNYVYSVIILIFLLLIWGIDLDAVGLFLSSVFAVIGIALFAQWSILSNVTSGIIMFFTFPYRIGDFIKIYDGDNSVYGYIEDIRSFQVIIQTIDGEVVAFPNSLMLLKGVAILNEDHIQKLKDQKSAAEQAKQ